MARQRPEAADDETALEVLHGELLVGDARGVVIRVLGAVELPLLLVGEVLEDDEKESKARERDVGECEGLDVWGLRQQEEGVCWGVDEEEERRLRQANEENVEEEEEETVVDL